MFSQEIRKFVSFGAVGALGTVVNTAMLYLLTQLGMFYLFASAIAIEVAIISNFFGNHFLTFRNDLDPSPLYKKFLSFQVVSITTIVASLAILWALTSTFGIEYLLVLNLVTILVVFALNFFVNRAYTWKKGIAFGNRTCWEVVEERMCTFRCTEAAR